VYSIIIPSSFPVLFISVSIGELAVKAASKMT